MSTEIRFDRASGTIEAPREALAALIALASGEPGGPERDGFEPLVEAGAVVDGRPHPGLARTLGPLRDPVCQLVLERGTRRGRGWVDPRSAAFLVPLPDGRQQLTSVPFAFVLDALVRLNDLSPRPRADPAVRMRLAAAELARLLAERDPSRASGAVDGEAETAALSGLVAALREHWRVEARWRPAPPSPGVRVIEVLDTDAGLWLVFPEEWEVELWPTTPTAVFRQLSVLLPATDELAEPPA